MTDFWRILPTVPADLRPILEHLYLKATSATADVDEALVSAAHALATASGDPDALEHGEHAIRVDVMSEITQAKTHLKSGLDGFNRSGAWEGSGANAFFDYIPRLLSAMTTLERSCETTAEAIAQFRGALAAVWGEVITQTGKAVTDTIAALAKSDDRLKADAVVNIVATWVAFVTKLTDVYLRLDEEKFKASDIIGTADADTTDLVRLSPNEHSAGPAGYQLPMPTDVSLDPDWAARDILPRWKLNGVVRVEIGAFREFVQALRDNGEFWNAAYRKQLQAWQAMPARAFSLVGRSFYQDLCKVLGRDSTVYFYSAERLNQLANLLDEVGTAYHQTDDESSRLIRDYLANE